MNNWVDTDSVSEESKIEVNGRTMTIGKFYHESVKGEGDIFHINDSEYVFPDNSTTVSYNQHTDSNEEMSIDYVYRHKVEKVMFEIEDEYGNIVTVTEDHSVMIERDGKFLEIKPTEILDTDLLIGL